MAAAKPSFGYWGSASEEILKTQFPIHCACRDGDVERLAFLLHEAHHGIYTEDSFYGWTPAHWAAYFGKLACLRKLMRVTSFCTNCDVKSSRFNQTPAHMAAFGGHPHCLQWLLQSNAEMNAKDYLGETPVHKAARTGSIECVSLLASHGADLHLKNYNGLNASELAEYCNYLECSRYLSSAMAATQGNQQLRGIHQELIPPIHSQKEEQPMPNGHATNGFQNGCSQNDCEMEMDSAESQTQPQVNGTRCLSNGTPPTPFGAMPMTNGFDHPHKPVNGFTNGHHVNGHCANGHSNHGNGDVGDVMLDSGVSTNQALVGGRKRGREDGDAGEMKRMRRGEPVVRNSFNGLPVSYEGSDESSVSSCSVNTSAVEHYSTMTVQQGYDSMFCDSMLSSFHGS